MAKPMTYNPSKGDRALRWFSYACIFGLLSVIGTCALHINQFQVQESEAVIQTSSIFPATPSSELQLRADLQTLQEENAKLRASLIETQQKIATLTIASKKKKAVVASNSNSSVNASTNSSMVSEKKTSRVQKIADNRRAKKKPKIIQISFEDESSAE